jgi:hypothetical protein
MIAPRPLPDFQRAITATTGSLEKKVTSVMHEVVESILVCADTSVFTADFYYPLFLLTGNRVFGHSVCVCEAS